ncbi:hypothetical protein [Aquisphaera insulae]|uniref:hypothetical protein n=1 Tax=Aquisphaera insulae TaxID=2712864 RepID=UPI0013E9BEBF|nr:hypothetical protein [Aquisphaera insulae]
MAIDPRGHRSGHVAIDPAIDPWPGHRSLAFWCMAIDPLAIDPWPSIRSILIIDPGHRSLFSQSAHFGCMAIDPGHRSYVAIDPMAIDPIDPIDPWPSIRSILVIDPCFPSLPILGAWPSIPIDPPSECSMFDSHNGSLVANA